MGRFLVRVTTPNGMCGDGVEVRAHGPASASAKGLANTPEAFTVVQAVEPIADDA